MKRLAAALVLCLWSSAVVAAWLPLAYAPAQQNAFFAAAGSDANPCSQASPCQTIARANAIHFLSGAMLQFNGGDTFSGGLVFTTRNSVGNLTVTSYGTGSPTISSGNSAACLTATNVPAVSVINIICTGGGNTTNSTDGIDFENTGAAQLAGPTVNNVTVSGYGGVGVRVFSGGNSGFNNSIISSLTVHDCTGHASNGSGTSGLQFDAFNAGSPSFPYGVHNGVTITNLISYNNIGVAGQATFTGSGLTLSNVTNFTVTGFLIHDNGADSASSGGPAGIVTLVSTNGTIKQGEVYNTTTNSATDGEGIAVDDGSQNITIQQTYVHNNQGSGIFLHTADNFTATGHIVRFNVSVNNGGTNGAQIALITDDTNQSLADMAVYNNTLYGNIDFIANGSSGQQITVQVSNNIFYSVTASVFAYVDYNPTNSTISFTGNNYFGNGNFNVAGTFYSTLSTWQTATGQEKISGSNVGHVTEPRLVVYGYSGAIAGYNPSSLAEYQLQSGSPMIGAGLNLATQYGYTLPASDFYGSTISASALPVGAGQQVTWTSGTGTCAAATTFLARTSGVDTPHQQQYNALICGLTVDGVYSGLDALYKLATDTLTDAELNIISSSYSLTPHGTTTFTANQGIHGDGSTGFLDTSFVPSTASGNCALNSCTLAFYDITNSTTSGNVGAEQTGTTATYFFFATGSSFAECAVNDSTDVSGTGTNNKAFWSCTRTSSAVEVLYMNGVANGNATPASVSLPNVSFYFLAQHNTAGGHGFLPDTTAYALIGAGFTAMQQLLLAYRLNADAIALGINAF